MEDASAMAVLRIRYPQALIIPMSCGMWVGHTCVGLTRAESPGQLDERLAEIYAEPCPVIPLRGSNGG
ncbi:hypothetical protein [Thermomonospora echinospora]|uniref:hypothetical protein n=1 Tax=Thermomonospora echinospora TaxID=1992 RepID=UPI0011B068B9|nr:hypothetical protein [Thermomonospora echinospora]